MRKLQEALEQGGELRGLWEEWPEPYLGLPGRRQWPSLPVVPTFVLVQHGGSRSVLGAQGTWIGGFRGRIPSLGVSEIVERLVKGLVGSLGRFDLLSGPRYG